MLLSAILIAGIESEFTRFVVAALSVTQLIYLSEVGAMLLGTKIPVNILDLFVIFILRTVVTLPVIVAVAHFVYPKRKLKFSYFQTSVYIGLIICVNKSIIYTGKTLGLI